MQLDLFIKSSQTQQKPPIWEHLSQEQKSALMATLSCVMTKIVHPKHKGDGDER